MKRTRFLFCLMVSAAAFAQQQITAIRNVTIIDATGGPAKSGQTVIIRGERIAEIGAVGVKLHVPKGARVIDGSGKFLIPGLWDMHTHVAGISADPRWGKLLLPQYLAHGVVGIRDMAGDLDTLLSWKKAQAAGSVIGPRMVISGPFLEGSAEGFTFPGDVIVVSTSEDARAKVRELKQRGSDFIKVGSGLNREAFFAIADEAKKQGITFVGHVPESVRVAEAPAAGMHSMEHLFGFELALSSKEAELRKRIEEARRNNDRPALAKALAEAVESESAEKADKLFASLKAHDNWQVPTLVWTAITSSLGEVTPDPHLKYVPAKLQSEWAPERAGKLISSGTRQYYARKLRSDLHYVKMMNDSGVMLLAGSDSLDPYVFPGDSLHRELAWLVEAGLTPMQALQAATRNPARFFGNQANAGTIEPGKLADLVLLDANPLEDIHNTQKINTVIQDGKIFPRAELDNMLKKVEREMLKIN